MDEALFSVLEQISGILSGYVAGIRASAHINDAPTIPHQTSQAEQRSRKGNVIQFIPRNRAEQRQEVLQQQKNLRANACRIKEQPICKK